MENGKIFYNPYGTEDCTIEAPTAAEGFGIEYIIDKNQGTVWRSIGITQNNIKMTFNSATIIKGIVVLNHNLQTGDTFKFEASTNDFTTTVQSIDIDPLKGFAEIEWQYQYYRLRVSKSAGEYIQVGEIYLAGNTYSFERNFNWNYTLTKEINRNDRITTAGQVYRTTRYIKKGFDLAFTGIDGTQKELFETIAESDYICFLPYGSEGPIYYGITNFSSFTHKYTDNWDVSINFTENPK